MELSVADSAARLGVSEEAVRARLRAGDLPGRQTLVGRRTVWRVDASAVDAWASRRRVHATLDRLPGKSDHPAAPTPAAGAADRRADEAVHRDPTVLESEIARLRRQVAVLVQTVAYLTDMN